MFNDFDSTKTQLSELAEIINKFKSEAVQIRVIELLFDSEPHYRGDDAPDGVSNTKSPRSRKRRPRSRKARTNETATNDNGSRRKRRAGARTGPISVLNQLFEENFFVKHKTIGDICSHAETNLARGIKPNEISGKLARMVRDRQLKRQKNSDGQYEYINS